MDIKTRPTITTIFQIGIPYMQQLFMTHCVMIILTNLPSVVTTQYIIVRCSCITLKFRVIFLDFIDDDDNDNDCNENENEKRNDDNENNNNDLRDNDDNDNT